MHEREGLEGRDRELDGELRQTLRQPVPLPEGLADRIVRAALEHHPAQSAEPAPALMPKTAQAWRRAVAAVLLFGVATGMGSGYLLSRHVRTQQVQRARVQFARAIEITDNTLRSVRQQVQRQLEQAAAPVPREPR